MAKPLQGRAGDIRRLMQSFIEERLAGKLEKLADDDPKRSELLEQFQFDRWVEDAVKKIGWLQVATHIIKLTDPKARGTSLLVEPAFVDDRGLVGTHALGHEFIDDVVGNAAALNAYAFISVEHEGISLLQMAVNEDPDFRNALNDDAHIARELSNKIARIMHPGEEKSSHALAKQVYWLVGDDPTDNQEFFLLAPLHSTSIAHEVYKNVQYSLYGEQTKLARKARRDNVFIEEGFCSYPGLAVQKLGSTKPQTVSQRNLQRGGNNYLLASLPPKWKSQGIKPPLYTESVFKRFGRRREVRWLASDLLRFLNTDPTENRHTRDRVDSYLAALIDELVLFSSEFRVLEPGWSADVNCRLPLEQQLWLDAGRADDDETFARLREQEDWVEPIHATFARWLNGWLKPLGTGDDEHQELERRLKRQLDLLKEELPHV